MRGTAASASASIDCTVFILGFLPDLDAALLNRGE
jgi:hypothetical protein